jgi:hypothetical protein
MKKQNVSFECRKEQNRTSGLLCVQEQNRIPESFGFVIEITMTVASTGICHGEPAEPCTSAAFTEICLSW